MKTATHANQHFVEVSGVAESWETGKPLTVGIRGTLIMWRSARRCDTDIGIHVRFFFF